MISIFKKITTSTTTTKLSCRPLVKVKLPCRSLWRSERSCTPNNTPNESCENYSQEACRPWRTQKTFQRSRDFEKSGNFIILGPPQCDQSFWVLRRYPKFLYRYRFLSRRIAVRLYFGFWSFDRKNHLQNRASNNVSHSLLS